MTLDDFRRLKKLMEMTFSDNDHEALSALRNGNKILAKEKLTWERVLDRSVSVAVPFESAAAATGDDDEEMEALFEVAMRGAKGSFRDTLDSIYDQFKSGRRLSERQREVVTNAAERNQGLR